MGSHQNLIEINGKKFDVATGKQLANSEPKAVPKPGTVVDGFIKSSATKSHTTPKVHHAKPAPTVKTATPKINHASQPHVVHHKPEKSKTLMRSSVKKPVMAPVSAQPKPKVGVSPARIQRAKSTPKSALINKFSSFSDHAAFVKKTAHVSVAKPPTNAAPVHAAQAPVHAPTIATPVSKSEQLFNNALSHATAHEAHKLHKKPRNRHITRHLKASRRIIQLSAGTLAVIILAGFFTYQNLPNLNLRIASTKAGFSASMPDYKPDGFGAASNIEHSPGKVTINFSSNSDDRNYHVTQRVSSWNSETLQENFLNAENKTFQTLQEKGKTIYLYDDSSATWVNGGVWYQIEGNSQLSNDQLLRIANSM